jgi:hypothetical protein
VTDTITLASTSIIGKVLKDINFDEIAHGGNYFANASKTKQTLYSVFFSVVLSFLTMTVHDHTVAVFHHWLFSFPDHSPLQFTGPLKDL